MLVKELVEQLLKLDQDKRIGITVHGYWESYVLQPKIELVPINSNSRIVFEKEAVEYIYEITEATTKDNS